MNGYLLDTNIVSILSPMHRELPINLPAVRWLQALEVHTFLSVVTVMEIESGIGRLVYAGSTRKAPQLRVWLEQLVDGFRESLLNVDERVARAAGQLNAVGKTRGRHPGIADVLVAATAVVGGLTVVTRNLRYFAMLEVAALDPFKSFPEESP